jgi:hypothetical protein
VRRRLVPEAAEAASSAFLPVVRTATEPMTGDVIIADVPTATRIALSSTPAAGSATRTSSPTSNGPLIPMTSSATVSRLNARCMSAWSSPHIARHSVRIVGPSGGATAPVASERAIRSHSGAPGRQVAAARPSSPPA